VARAPDRDLPSAVESARLTRGLERDLGPVRDELLKRCGEPVVLDYVRLNMTATRV
jgi:hypothetical protein